MRVDSLSLFRRTARRFLKLSSPINCGLNYCQFRHSIRGFGLKVVFYGSDEFSLSTLKLLEENKQLDGHREEKAVTSLHVISKEPTIVSNYAKQHQIPFNEWPYSLPPNAFDVGIVVSFGQLIPAQAISACRLGVLNVHGSLLPRWRGAAPIHRTILVGDKQTGVTVMRIMADKFDVGQIVLQEAIKVPNRATTRSLYDTMAQVGARLMMRALLDLEKYLAEAKHQPSEGVTYARKPTKVEGHLIWSQMSADEVDRRFRAFDGSIDVYTHWINGIYLKLFDMVDPMITREAQIDRLVMASDAEPGAVYYHKKKKLLCIKCCDGQWAAFGGCQLKGKKRMSALSFYNGFMSREASLCPKGLLVLPSDLKDNHVFNSSQNISREVIKS